MSGAIYVTGNSGIDALGAVAGPLPAAPLKRWIPRRALRLLVTCHRRENWDDGLNQLAAALLELAGRAVKIMVVLPPNPAVTRRMIELFGAQPRIRLAPPMSHAAMIEAMRRCDLILSDSSGIQEEAPPLGVPLLILRSKTDRPEGIATESMELVGTETGRIVAAVERLRCRSERASMARPAMPFGDGHAAPRIAAHCTAYLDELAPDRSVTA